MAIVRTGCMGKGLFCQCSFTAGIQCDAIADFNIQRARNCVQWPGGGRRIGRDLGGILQTIWDGVPTVSPGMGSLRQPKSGTLGLSCRSGVDHSQHLGAGDAAAAAGRPEDCLEPALRSTPRE